ncbi:MAG TPA: hypothetical protein VJN96_23070, partial [Vicinamibacterales bacterium]|nr:hypothetical protein [Vicinamibacterales bacterium]
MPRAKPSSGDRLFYSGTGLFALLVVLLVAGIALVLTHQSEMSLGQFGLKFWTSSKWDPVAGEFGALPFIWGTL